jgi:hypothetical protein
MKVSTMGIYKITIEFEHVAKIFTKPITINQQLWDYKFPFTKPATGLWVWWWARDCSNTHHQKAQQHTKH